MSWQACVTICARSPGLQFAGYSAPGLLELHASLCHSNPVGRGATYREENIADLGTVDQVDPSVVCCGECASSLQQISDTEGGEVMCCWWGEKLDLQCQAHGPSTKYSFTGLE